MFKFGDDGDKQLAEALNNYPYCEGHKDNRGCYIAPSCDVCAMNRAMEAEHIKETLAKLGYRKESDVAREIITEIADLIWQGESEKMNFPIASRYYNKQEFISHLKKKYESEGAEDEVSREG